MASTKQVAAREDSWLPKAVTGNIQKAGFHLGRRKGMGSLGSNGELPLRLGWDRALLLPNPYTRANVRFAHGIEVRISNFVHGAISAYSFTPNVKPIQETNTFQTVS
jgi:hypothetical protein